MCAKSRQADAGPRVGMRQTRIDVLAIRCTGKAEGSRQARSKSGPIVECDGPPVDESGCMRRRSDGWDAGRQTGRYPAKTENSRCEIPARVARVVVPAKRDEQCGADLKACGASRG